MAFKMTEWVEQWICIIFCVKLEHSSAETIQWFRKLLRMMQWNPVQIKVWHKHYKDGWESVESDPHSEKPGIIRTPENVERVWAAIDKFQLMTVWELEADLGIPKTTMSEILMQDLGMKHAVAKFVPWLLLPKQKEHCATGPNALIQTTTSEPRNS